MVYSFQVAKVQVAKLYWTLTMGQAQFQTLHAYLRSTTSLKESNSIGKKKIVMGKKWGREKLSDFPKVTQSVNE